VLLQCVAALWHPQPVTSVVVNLNIYSVLQRGVVLQYSSMCALQQEEGRVAVCCTELPQQRCSVLQCVEVCCSVLQSVAVCCSV